MARPRVPVELTRAPLRTLRPKDLQSVFPVPRPQLARLVQGGAVRRLAPGYFTAIPDAAADTWQPTIEAAGLAVATAIFGSGVPVLMGASAARVHRVVPRALDEVTVAVPRQHRQIRLTDGGVVRFVMRDVERLDARQEELPDLGRGLVTTEEQTVLDLAKRGDIALGEDGVTGAITALLGRCDRGTLERLATEQHLRSALARVDAITR